MALAPIVIGTRPMDKEKLNIILRIYIMIKTVPVAYLVTSFFFPLNLNNNNNDDFQIPNEN